MEYELSETHQFVQLCHELGVKTERELWFPLLQSAHSEAGRLSSSDGYPPANDLLIDVARQIDVVRQIDRPLLPT